MPEIKISPFTVTPRGTLVVYRKDGVQKSRRFPVGTSGDEIVAILNGRKIAKSDPGAEQQKKEAEEKTRRAANSQPGNTPDDKTVQKKTAQKDGAVKTIAAMKAALVEKGVAGANMLKGDAVKKLYTEHFSGKEEKKA